MRNAVKDSLLLPNSVIVILGLELPQFDVTSFLASGASFYAANRAVARFFVTEEGIIAVAKGASSVGAKIFKFGGYETLFSALVMRYVSEESTSNKCEKAGIFSAYKCLFRRSC